MAQSTIQFKSMKPKYNTVIYVSFKIDTILMRYLIHALKNTVSEVKIYIKNDKLYVVQMDGSHICLVYLEINKTELKDYKYMSLPPKEKEVYINVEDLYKILEQLEIVKTIETKKKGKIEGLNEELTIEIGDKYLYFECMDTNGMLELISGDTDDINFEELNKKVFHNNFEINLSKFKKALKLMMVVSEVVELIIDSNMEHISANAEGSIAELTKKLAITDPHFTKSGSVGDYALTIINNMFSNLDKFVNRMRVYVDLDSPIKFEFKFGLNSKLMWYTAPRVEEDKTDDDN